MALGGTRLTATAAVALLALLLAPVQSAASYALFPCPHYTLYNSTTFSGQGVVGLRDATLTQLPRGRRDLPDGDFFREARMEHQRRTATVRLFCCYLR